MDNDLRDIGGRDPGAGGHWSPGHSHKYPARVICSTSRIAIVRFSEIVQIPAYKYTEPFPFKLLCPQSSQSPGVVVRADILLLFGEVISESDKFYEFSW